MFYPQRPSDIDSTHAVTKSMTISQPTLLISSKHDLLFIAVECLQGSRAVWWISARQEAIISSMSYWIPQECTQFSLSRGPWGRFQLGRANLTRSRSIKITFRHGTNGSTWWNGDLWHHDCGDAAAQDSMSADGGWTSVRPLICAWTFSNEEDKFRLSR